MSIFRMLLNSGEDYSSKMTIKTARKMDKVVS